MDKYNRVWRDARSPLTPLTPLNTNVFDFEHPSDITPTAEPSMRNKTSFRSLQPSRLRLPHQAPPPSRRSTGASKRTYSQDFLRVRSVFSPTCDNTSTRDGNSAGCSFNATRNQSSSKNCTTSIRHNSQRIKTESFTTQMSSTSVSPAMSRLHIKREFKHGSPVEQPSLCPRVRALLNRTGNTHLTEMFTRQEIDLEVLIQMTLEDLEALGVRGAKELKLAMDVIKFAKKYIF